MTNGSAAGGSVPRGDRWYLYFAVSAGGASVLAVEILGTRILGPFYGVGLFLWSALITVTLAALSAGYAAGGRWADRGATIGRFALLYALAGAWLVLVPLLKGPVIALSGPAGLRGAVLISSSILFFPPLALLGMASPYAVKLRAASLGEVGRSAGDLYAVSTVASVAAALATGFFLIPHVGVNRLLFLTGALLLATAAAGLLTNDRRRGVAALLPAAAAALLGVRASSSLPPGVLSVRESQYGEIRVVEHDGGRHMLIDGFIHTSVDPADFSSRSAYVDVIDLAAGFFEDPGPMLLIGLGGGSIARSWSAAGWSVEAVEIDEAVTETARRFFGLRPGDARVHHGDGRRFLVDTRTTYDVIVFDAFGGSSIPFHLVTSEAFALAGERLAPDGVIAVNLIAAGWRHPLVGAVASALRESFAHVTALPTAEPPTSMGNVILIASRRPLRPLRDPPPPDGRFGAAYERSHAWDNRFEPGSVEPPTDEMSRADLWAESINLAVRRDLHRYFPEEMLGW